MEPWMPGAGIAHHSCILETDWLSSAPSTGTQQWNILFFSGCYEKYHTWGDLQGILNYSSQLRRVGSPRSRCRQIYIQWASASWSMDGISFLGPHMVQRGKQFSGVCFIRVLTPFIRTPTPWPNNFPKSTILGILLKEEFGEIYTNIQSTVADV